MRNDMLAPLKLILLVAAFLCFVLGVTNIISPTDNRLRVMSLGLACWVASQLF